MTEVVAKAHFGDGGEGFGFSWLSVFELDGSSRFTFGFCGVELDSVDFEESFLSFEEVFTFRIS
jgi:hypothetical protein